ncbi:MAG: hypothetical protein QM775_25055 [Pirellulales bacterium]
MVDVVLMPTKAFVSVLPLPYSASLRLRASAFFFISSSVGMRQLPIAIRLFHCVCQRSGSMPKSKPVILNSASAHSTRRRPVFFIRSISGCTDSCGRVAPAAAIAAACTCHSPSASSAATCLPKVFRCRAAIASSAAMRTAPSLSPSRLPSSGVLPGSPIACSARAASNLSTGEALGAPATASIASTAPLMCALPSTLTTSAACSLSLSFGSAVSQVSYVLGVL